MLTKLIMIISQSIITIKSCCTLESNIMLCVNYSSLKKEMKISDLICKINYNLSLKYSKRNLMFYISTRNLLLKYFTIPTIFLIFPLKKQENGNL